VKPKPGNVLIDGGYTVVSQPNGISGTGLVLDNRLLAKDPAQRYAPQHTLSFTQFHFTFQHHEHKNASLAFFEDSLIGSVRTYIGLAFKDFNEWQIASLSYLDCVLPLN
jgi:hypothetical protein